jgi:ABC-2 type transport system ATP-binding protein
LRGREKVNASLQGRIRGEGHAGLAGRVSSKLRVQRIPRVEKNVLEVDHLVKRYGDFTAVDAISFRVREGEIFGFLGPNGAGKTTTINMLTGLAGITSGSVRVGDFDYPRDLKRVQRIIGIVPDESNLYEELDGFGNLIFCASLYGMRKPDREERARELLSRFGLADTGNKPFRAYSKGMKRKLTVAAGIIHQPQILFLDEPTTGIDVASARQIRQLVLDLNRSGATIFLTTHYIEEAERLCRRVAFIVRGKIVRIGTIDELMKEVQQENIVQFTIGNGANRIQTALRSEFPEFRVEAASDSIVKVRSPRPLNLTPFMGFLEKNDVAVYEAKIGRPSLEEVFVQITGIEIEKMRMEKEGRKP